MPTSMTKIKKMDNTNYWMWRNFWQECKIIQSFGKKFWQFLIKLIIYQNAVWLRNSTCRYLSKRNEMPTKGGTYECSQQLDS